MEMHLQHNCEMFPRVLFAVVLPLLMSAYGAFWLLLSVLKFSGGCPAEGEQHKMKGDVPYQPDLKQKPDRKPF